MATYSDPYEDWKAQGKPGGNYNAWLSQQGGGAPAQTPTNIPLPAQAQPVGPTQPAPAPAAAPAATGGPSNSIFGDLSGFKTYADWQAANRAAGGSGQSNQIAAIFGGPSYDTGGVAIPGGGTTPYTGPADTNTWQTNVPMTDNAHPDSFKPSGDPFVDMIRAQGKGQSEDYARFSNAQILAWKNQYDAAASQQAGHPVFRNDFGDLVAKPTESGPNSKGAGYATGERSGGHSNSGVIGPGGGGGGGGAGAGGGYGGAPLFNAPKFTPPNPNSIFSDPSFQFRLNQGEDALQKSAAAKGVLRTSGTLKGILDYGQDAASQEYSNIFNRAAQTYGLNYTAAKDEFAPLYGSWQTTYQGDLQKYLNREDNIFGLINVPAPQAPVYY